MQEQLKAMEDQARKLVEEITVKRGKKRKAEKEKKPEKHLSSVKEVHNCHITNKKQWRSSFSLEKLHTGFRKQTSLRLTLRH
jgi:hypothetical protein